MNAHPFRSAVAVILIALALTSCAHGPRAPHFETSPDAAELLAALEDVPAGDSYTASLFLEFEGGFLEEDRLKINGEIALEWPEKVRLIGAYGAFKKVFDLLVLSERFQVFDHQEGVLWRGMSRDTEAAHRLGLALRPADIARLMRIDGTGPLEGATIREVETNDDAIRVAFGVDGDAARWTVRFDPETLDVRSLTRTDSAGGGVEARYEGYFRSGGRRVPRRVDVRRLDGDERVRIELRSIRFRDAIDPKVFTPAEAVNAEIVDL